VHIMADDIITAGIVEDHDGILRKEFMNVL